MAGSAGFTITISAADHVTAQVRAINKSLQAIRAPAERLTKEFKRLSELSGLKRLGEGMRHLGERVRETGRHLREILAPLGVLTGAATIAGVTELVVRFGEWGRSLQYASQRLGVAAPQLHVWQGAARLAGLSAESMTGALGNLQMSLSGAQWGQNSGAMVALSMLGFSMASIKRGSKDVAAFLPELADRIARLRDPAKQVWYAQALGVGALLPLLQQGRAGLERYREEAARLYPVTQQDIGISQRFAEAQGRLSLAFDHLYERAVVNLAPAMTQFMDRMSKWLAQPQTAQGLADAIMGIANAIQEVPWKSIGSAIREIWEYTNGLVKAFGGWKVVIEEILALWVTKKVGGFLVGAAGSVWGIGKALRAGAAWLSGKAPAAASTVAEAAPKVVPKGVGLFGDIAEMFGLSGIFRGASGLGGIISRLAGPFAILQTIAEAAHLWGNVSPQTGKSLNPANPLSPPARFYGPGPGHFLQGMMQPPEAILGRPAGTQSDPLYTKPADAAGALYGGVGPSGAPGAIPWLSGAFGDAQRRLALSVAEAGTGRQLAAWFQKRFGLNAAQASGIIGSTVQESGLNPTAVGPGGDYGLMQWVGARRAGLFALAQQMGQSPSSVAVQEAFIAKELSAPWGRSLLEKMRQTRTPQEAAHTWYEGFEAQGAPVYEGPRGSYAEQFYERFMGSPSGAPHADAAPPSGHAHLTVRVHAPLGTTARATSSGTIWSAPPRVELPLSPSFGALP